MIVFINIIIIIIEKSYLNDLQDVYPVRGDNIKSRVF